MIWANFLHIYQPPRQVTEIFDRVVNESYRPLIESFKQNPEIKINLNINGSLSEQLLERGYEDVIEGLRFVAERGQIEFTDSAKYHALLPLLPEDEIRRQIILNRQTNQEIFGSVYKPAGFFPSEMAYAPNLPAILENLGYKWIIIDEIGLNGKVNQVDTKIIYEIADTDLKVFFRERNPSNLIMSALVRREQDFQEIMKDEYIREGYMVTGMDGETFGHHRPGLLKLLIGLLTSKDFDHAFISELPKFFKAREEISPVTSTWASTEKDIKNGVQFLTWKDPENLVHTWQWELQRLALSVVKARDEKNPKMQLSRHKLDQALASDHFFWASARPWWSLEVVEAGAWALLDTIRSVPDVEEAQIRLAEDYYQKIIAKIFEWQRTGYIRKIYKEYKEHPRVPFKTRTIEKGEPWVYDAFVELMKKAVKEAAKKENFEKAILWRDAIWKLETKNDIYDAIHAVDLLRKQITNAEILDMIGKYRKKYERLSSGQPEQRGL
ncbi:hypothetical protein KJA15_04335 [Patescibacteria group bacterium]|nr:hypothetical protein [Patescibacteria group bacterium]